MSVVNDEAVVSAESIESVPSVLMMFVLMECYSKFGTWC